MLYPSIDKLMEKADSKYSLVIMASKRARSLLEGTTDILVRAKSHKNVGIALEEIHSGVVVGKRPANYQQEKE
ncbi:DNA-directed RNA polymerase subunit omega [Risungbinella massiliensis]|uniref:DNA-directed RNA polymerase subunit omega n=1 Tax=Risungbinella massiliensis TaxID=1329796 RepID=UPI0005CC5CD1|nr:DNA-directed RNA polymerase subunit omega [Risungbinella massiliensis]